MKKFVSWAAVSSLPQAKKISLEDQLITNRQHVERHGGALLAELVVPGESRNIVMLEEACRRIEAYQKLYDLIEAKSFDVLIYLDRSRLGRTAALSMTIAELCNRAGILLYEIESPPSSLEFNVSHNDQLMGAIKSVGAQHEIAKIQERHRKGMKDRAEKGKFANQVNFGYVRVFEGGKLTGYAIDEKAAAAIRLIFHLYLDRGMGTLPIADALNRVPNGSRAPRGGDWADSTVGSIIDRAWIYAGFLEANMHSKTDRPYLRTKGMWPSIISEDTARRILAERDSRRGNGKSVSSTYRFSRMCYCNVCGGKMLVDSGMRKIKRASGRMDIVPRMLFRCYSGHGTISEKKIHVAMQDFLERMTEKAHREGLINDTATTSASDPAIEMEALQNRLDKLRANIRRADDDYYVRGDVGDALDAERHATIVAGIKKQIAAILAEMTILADKLADEERHQNRWRRIEEIHETGMEQLSNPDAREANAWFRPRLRIWIEARQVVAIEIL